MKEIIAKDEFIIKVDDDDYEVFKNLPWNTFITNGHQYAYYSSEVRLMHVEIGKLHGFSFEEVHHKNDNGLDNRKENLAFLTRSLHQRTRPPQSRTLSGKKGVYRGDRGWRARVALPGNKRINCGNYSTIEEAARAYDKKVRELFGPNAFTNYPL